MKNQIENNQVKVEKIAHIKLDNDYGGEKAGIIKVTINGMTTNDYDYVQKREHFDSLQETIQTYLKLGYKIEIENQ